MLVNVICSKDYAAYGHKDGIRMYGNLQRTEENRRQLILKAARELKTHAAETKTYLEGLEAGIKEAGATEATARRLRYEAAAVIDSYGIAIEVLVPCRRSESSVKIIPKKNSSEVIPEINSSEVVSEKKRLDFRDLEAQESWLALVNTARTMRQAENTRKRLREGLPEQLGRGNHTARKFEDAKFEKLREQLIERTATSQALDLLDAGIIAVANAYADIAADEIESLREAEQRIHDKLNARNSGIVMQTRIPEDLGKSRVARRQF